MLRQLGSSLWCLGAALVSLSLQPPPDRPSINQRFPVDERSISPPSITKPIHDCARAVHVAGFISKAIVKVQANGVEVGSGSSKFADLDVMLTRAVHLNEKITATQSVGPVTSDPSDAVTVDKYPNLTTPVVSKEVFACGRVAPVENLVASTRVEVSDLSAPGAPVVGTTEATRTVAYVPTSSLVQGHNIQAVQVACPADPARIESPKSSAVPVKAAPTPMPKPTVGKGFVEGSEVLVGHGLLPGAEVEFKAGSIVISSGRFATGADTWFPLDVPVPAGNPPITARQKLCVWSPPSAAVFPERDLPKPVLGSACEGSRIVAIDRTMPGANVVLFRRAAGAGTPLPAGYGGGVPGTLMLHVGKGVTLQGGDVITAVQYIGNTVSPVSDEVRVGCGGGFNVVTQHNDNYRTGSYLAESTLLPDAVLSHGMEQAFVTGLEGAITTQPLYVRELQFRNGGANVVFIGSSNNIMYAIHATNGNIIWRHPFVDPEPRRSFARGVDRTPVIDVAANRMYVLFHTSAKAAAPDGKDYKVPGMDSTFWLVALDLRDGRELLRRRVSGWVYRKNGERLDFEPANHVSHPALLLDHGSVYIAFGSQAAAEADEPYLSKFHGWVMRYRAADLAPQSVFCTSPNADGRINKFNPKATAPGSGIWQGGGGLAADPDGNTYFLTGNGRADIPNALYGDAFVKLTPSGSTLVPAGFVPSPPVDPDPDHLELQDADLGSGGAMVIPGLNFVIGGGKTGWMYLLNRTTMQLQQRLTAATNLRTNRRLDGGPTAWKDGPHLHGSPTMWVRDDARFLYVWGEKDVLRQYQLSNTTGQFTQVNQATVVALEETMPGGQLSVSAAGGRRRTGVVWATLPAANENWPMRTRIYAFDADDLKPLWDDEFGKSAHWPAPTIADAMVYLGTGDGKLVAYKLGPERNRTKWDPTLVGPAVKVPPKPRCLSCHTAPALTELQKLWPLEKRFKNEAAMRMLPAIALRRSSPPAGVTQRMTLEGNGLQSYRAERASRGSARLQWVRADTTADLIVADETGARTDKTSQPASVRLERGGVWVADGTRVASRLEKTTRDPEGRAVPWMLFRIARPAERGTLAGMKYIQAIKTHGGRPPDRAPARAGEIVRVPFFAEYWAYGDMK